MNTMKKYFALTLLTLVNSANAFQFPCANYNNMRGFLALSVGASQTPHLGVAKNFPITDPVTEEFYNYAPHHTTATARMIDGYMGVEVPFYPLWAMQIGIDFNQQTTLAVSGTLKQGADNQSVDFYEYRFNVLTRQFLLLSKILYTYKNTLHPYFLVGVGVSSNKASGYTTEAPLFLTFTRMFSDHNTGSFSYLIGVGVDIDVTQHIRLGAAYRFASLGQVKLGMATIDNVPVSGTLTQDHWYANQVLLQMTLLA